MLTTLPSPLDDVREAPTQPDPYPAIAALAVDRPLYRDAAHGFWVAAGAEAVKAVLESRLCLTRPTAGRVPEAIAAGPMGEVYGRLVRLRDDEAGGVLKAALARALSRLDLADAARAAEACAEALGETIQPEQDRARLTQFMYAMPITALAGLLGASPGRCSGIGAAIGDYGVGTAAIATSFPPPTDALVAKGHAGAALLSKLAEALIAQDAPAPLLQAWLDEARAAGCAPADIAANAAGLLVQGYGAMAASIGLTLLALARNPNLRHAAETDRKALRPLIAETMRLDPTAFSTIRFLAADGVVAGQAMREGEAIIVLLAAASHDPASNPDRHSFGFGAGRHACPGDKLAPLIVETGVRRLLARGVSLDGLEAGLSYAPSAHIRTPIFRD